jgi:pilus assembly protein Flp/PilA
MVQLIKRFVKEEDGVTAIEYGLIAALIAMVIVAAVTTAGQSLNTLWENIAAALTAATN